MSIIQILTLVALSSALVTLALTCVHLLNHPTKSPEPQMSSKKHKSKYGQE